MAGVVWLKGFLYVGRRLSIQGFVGEENLNLL